MQSWVSQILSSVMPQKVNEEEVVVYNEPLNRNENFLKGIQNATSFITSMIDDHYEAYTTGFIINDIEGVAYDTPYAKGCVFYKNEDYSTVLYQQMMETMKERVLSTGYQLARSIIQIRETTNWKKSKEIYYLKPPLNADAKSPFNQRYGQILLEHHLEDNETSLFKILCTYYNGRQYSEPFPFEDFFQYLMKDEK